MTTKKISSIDEYHAAFPKNVQEKLEVIRTTIKQIVPHAKEVISYNMPAFEINGIVAYYSAFKKHISLYPVPNGEEWQKDFKLYKTSGKGTIQFPLDKPIPTDLIEKIVNYRVKEDLKKKNIS